MKKDLQQISREIENQRWNQLAEDVTAFSSLTELSDRDIKTMPLNVYEEYFKDLFDGKIELSENDSIIIAKYVSYAGNAKRPVLVVDDDNNIVKRLDGIYQITPIKFIETVSGSINTVALAEAMEIQQTRPTGQFEIEAIKETMARKMTEIAETTIERKAVIQALEGEPDVEIDDLLDFN